MINSNFLGNIQKPVFLALTSTTPTQVGATAADNTQTLSSWAFTNTTGAAVICALYYNDGSDRQVWRKSVAANSTEIESNLPIRLMTGYLIKAQGDTGINVTLIYTAAYPFT